MVCKIIGVAEGRTGFGVPVGVADAVTPIVEDGVGIVSLLPFTWVQLVKKNPRSNHKIVMFFKIDIGFSLWL